MPLGPPRVIGFPGLWGPKAPGLWDPGASRLRGFGAPEPWGPPGPPWGAGPAALACSACMVKRGLSVKVEKWDFSYFCPILMKRPIFIEE